MARPTEESSARRPLQQLLSLDKDYTSVSERLGHARRLAGLDRNARQTSSSGPIAQAHIIPRAEWVLDWLLKKLKATDEFGWSARHTAASWDLLTDLIEYLPSTSSAKRLSTGGILSSSKQTLEETFSDVQVGQVNCTGVSDSATFHEETQSKIRKRKRAGTPNGTHNQETDTQDEIFGALARTLSSVVHRSKQRALTGGNGHIHMRNVLRSDAPQAAHMLGLWLRALQVVDLSAYPVSIAVDDATSPFLAPILEVWSLKRTSAASTKVPQAEMTQHCFLPLLSVLGRLSKDERSANYTSSDLLLSNLSRLLMLEILLPVRRSLIQVSADGFGDAVALNDLMAPLASVITEYELKLQEDAAYSQISVLLSAVQCVWEECLNVVPRKTPAQRAKEARWLSPLFRSLCTCIRCPTDTLAPVVPRPVFKASLKSLLVISQRLDHAIDRETLTTILLNYTQDFQTDASLEWDLLSILTELSPNILRLENTAFEPNIQESMRAYSRTLFHCLGKIQTDSDKDQTKSILKGIMIPLMHAYAATRDLPKFLTLWQQQLDIDFSQHGPSETEFTDHSFKHSMWQSEELVLAFSGIFENSLTSSQIMQLLQDRIQELERAYSFGLSLETRPERNEALASPHASVYMLDTYFRAIRSYETLDEHTNMITSLSDLLVSAIIKNGDLFGWSLSACWKLLNQLLLILWPRDQAQSSKYPDAADKLLGKANALVAMSCKSDRVQQSQALRATVTEAFTYAIIVCDQSLCRSEKNTDAVESMLSLRLDAHGKLLDGLNWAQFEKESESSHPGFDYEFAAALAVWPSMLSALSQPIRVRLYRLLFHCTLQERESRSPTTPWFELLQLHLNVSLELAIRDDFISTSCEALKDVSRDNYAPATLAAELLLQMPSSTMRRQLREDVLNTVLRAGESLKLLELWHGWLLTAHLVQEPVATANISIDPVYLQRIASHTFNDSNTYAALRDQAAVIKNIMYTVLHHLALTKEQPRSINMFESLQTYLSDRASELGKNSGLGHVLFYGAFVNVCSAYQITFDKTNCDTALLKGINRQLRHWRKSSRNAGSSPSHDVSGVLFVQEAVNILCRESETKGGAGKTSSEIRDSLNSFKDDIAAWQLPLALTLQLQRAADVSDDQVGAQRTTALSKSVDHFRDLISQLENLDDEKNVLSTVRTIHYKIGRLSPDKKADLFYASLSSEETSSTDLQLTNLLLPQIERVDSKQRLQVMTNSVTKLCSTLQSSASLSHAIIACRCISVILSTKPFLVDQFTVETLLGSLANITRAPGQLFLQICNLLRLVISLHRNRLANRLGLVTVLLQRLLATLHTAPTPSRQYAYTIDHASAVSRVLSTLCSPTPSSVSRHHRSSKTSLVDEVKQAKAEIGAYIPPVLVRFCEEQLNGKLGHGMREALLPGLFDAIETMGEGMRVLNGALTGQQRAVWRGVVGEWRRGRGENRS